MSVRNWNLGRRSVIYTVAMLLLTGLFLAVLYFTRWWSDDLLSKDRPVLLPWLVCFGAGLVSLVVVEPFRRPSGSPYGFLIGGAVRTLPPLILVIWFMMSDRPILPFFWGNVLIAYFGMLSVVIPLTLPAQTVSESTPSGEPSE